MYDVCLFFMILLCRSMRLYPLTLHDITCIILNTQNPIAEDKCIYRDITLPYLGTNHSLRRCNILFPHAVQPQLPLMPSQRSRSSPGIATAVIGSTSDRLPRRIAARIGALPDSSTFRALPGNNALPETGQGGSTTRVTRL